MYSFMICLFLFIFVTDTTYGFNKPPSYIKPCSKLNNFNACALKNGQDAIKYIVEGDPTYHIPNMKPFKLEYVSLDAADNIKLYATNMSIYGFELAELQKLDWNFDTKIVKVTLFLPVISLVATYNMDGKVLIMTIKGSGPMNNTFYNNTVNVQSHYEFQTNKEKNYEFAQLTRVEVKVHVENVHLYFGNLLNNPVLSAQMNTFLNENWRFLVEDLNVSSEKIMSRILISIFNPIAAKIPYQYAVKP